MLTPPLTIESVIVTEGDQGADHELQVGKVGIIGADARALPAVSEVPLVFAGEGAGSAGT